MRCAEKGYTQNNLKNWFWAASKPCGYDVANGSVSMQYGLIGDIVSTGAFTLAENPIFQVVWV